MLPKPKYCFCIRKTKYAHINAHINLVVQFLNYWVELSLTDLSIRTTGGIALSCPQLNIFFSLLIF